MSKKPVSIELCNERFQRIIDKITALENKMDVKLTSLEKKVDRFIETATNNEKTRQGKKFDLQKIVIAFGFSIVGGLIVALFSHLF